MQEWFEGLVGPDYALIAMAATVLVLALVLLFIVLKLLRRGPGGTYVAGGRNRKTRLAVMDATAIDNYRRLVLVRRDDVEHLILIGGSADIVVERDIRMVGQARRPAAEPVFEQPEPAPQPAPRPVPQPQPRPAPARPVAAEPPRQPYTPPARPAPAPVVAPPRPAPQPAPRQTPPPVQSSDEDFDDELLRELEVELDTDKPAPAAKGKPAEVSLDDEMAKLLGELSNNNRR